MFAVILVLSQVYQQAEEQKMKLEIFARDSQYGWRVVDEYGDEVSASDGMFDNREECRQEAYAALEDWAQE